MLNERIDRQTKTTTRRLTFPLNTSAETIPLEEESFFSLILGQLRRLVDYQQAILASVENEQLIVLAYRRPVSIEEEMMRRLPGGIEADSVPPDASWPALILFPPLEKGSPLADAAQTLIDKYQPVMQNKSDFWLMVPLVFKNQTTGLLLFSRSSPPQFSVKTMESLLALSNYMAQVLGNQQLYQRARNLAILEERNRLAQELHDNVAQTLAYLKFKIFTTSKLLTEGQQAEVQNNLQELKHMIDETYTDVREEIFNLRAEVSMDMSFLTMLRQYIAKYKRYYNMDIQLAIEMNETHLEFPPDISQQVVHIIQEALVNVRKHAGKKQAQLRFKQEGPQICISIIDNGQGFEAGTKRNSKKGFGLQIMQERAESVGGTLKINTTPGQGVEIILRLPVFSYPVKSFVYLPIKTKKSETA